MAEGKHRHNPQIVDPVARSGFSGPGPARIAAHNTRDRKEVLSPAEVMAAHRQIASEFGNQANRVVAEARERRLNSSQEQLSEERRQRAQAAMTFARDRSFEGDAVRDERALFVDAMRRRMVVPGSETTTLAVMREGAETNGYEVEGLAPTSRAAQQLRDAGIPADTLQRFFACGNRQPDNERSRHLYMIDESSLA